MNKYNVSTPTKTLPCKSCHLWCTSIKENTGFLHCGHCICTNKSCNENWYICTLHGCRYKSKNRRFFSHFNNDEHLPTLTDTDITHVIPTTSSICYDDTCSHHSSSMELWNDVNDDISIIDQSSSLIPSSSPNKRFKTDINSFPNDIPNNSFNKNTQQYLKDELNNPGDGVKGLAARSFACSSNSTAIANHQESRLHMNLTYLCNSITTPQQHLLSCVINDLMKPDIFDKTRPPMSLPDIKKFYTKSTTSINKNLPSPRAFEIDGHACVSIESVIDHMLLFGVPMNTLSTNLISQNDYLKKNIAETQEAKDIIDTVQQMYTSRNTTIYIIYLIVWSDDFEVNCNRKSQNSTWLMTVSICPPSNLKTSSICTSPIALGRKGSCHDTVRNHFNEEIERLQNKTMRYSSSHKGLISVVVKPLVISADRPERSSLNEVLGHGGKSTKRWTYSEIIDRKKLPTCETCFISRFNKINNGIIENLMPLPCTKCCDWDMSSGNKSSLFLPPSNYPTKQHPNSPDAPKDRGVSSNSDFHLGPVKVDYCHLTKCLKYAFWNYLHSEWNKGQTSAYLRLVGISTRFINKTIEFASLNKSSLPVDKSILEKIPLPSMWRSVYRLEQCIDTPMHLLFQGVVDSIITEMQSYFKFHKKWSFFGKNAFALMDEINKLQSDFCRVETFNGGDDYTTGGWIAESYLGFSRIFSIIISPTCQFLKRDNLLGWNEFQMMIQSLNAMLARLMCEIDVSIDDITTYIKIFLSCCTRYYETVYGTNGPKDKNPFWNSPNFLSLLNLPQQIKQFGSVRLHWEGIHERFIQYVKPHLKNMRTTTSYLLLKLQEIHDHNVLKEILIDEECIKPLAWKRYKSTLVYKTNCLVKQLIREGNCIMACIIHSDHSQNIDRVNVGIRYDKVVKLGTIVFDDSNGYHLNNQWFCTIEYIDTDLNDESLSMNDFNNNISDHVILVPSNSFADNKTRFSVIAKSWLTRNYESKMVLPNVSIN